MRAALLFGTLALASMANAQVFTSGFENWTDTLPDGWVGVKTNINLDSIEQVSVNPHSGNYAVRLYNQPNSTKRFTTQGLQVDSLQAYTVTYWVRGTGEIRAALFDGRTENNGYSPNTAYEAISSTEWVQKSMQLVCDHDNPTGEFILYVRNTAAPERLVVDDVNIEETVVQPPQPRSIYQVQYTTDVNGVSPEVGNTVITGGIVTGVDTIGADGYFVQAGSGPWSGIYVFDNGNHPAVGDSVTFQAVVQEFHAGTELASVSSFTIVGSFPVPAAAVLNAAALNQEQWEGVLCQVLGATCSTINAQNWTTNDGSADLLIGSQMFVYAPTVGLSYDVTGCMMQYDASRELHPRDLDDVQLHNGIAEEGILHNAMAWPNPASDRLFVNTGITGNVVATLTDLLGRTARTAVINGNTSFDLTGLNTGLYHLTLIQSNSVKRMAIMVK